MVLFARANLEHEQTDKHKLVTHNLGDIGKVRVTLFSTRAQHTYYYY